MAPIGRSRKHGHRTCLRGRHPFGSTRKTSSGGLANPRGVGGRRPSGCGTPNAKSAEPKPGARLTGREAVASSQSVYRESQGPSELTTSRLRKHQRSGSFGPRLKARRRWRRGLKYYLNRLVRSKPISSCVGARKAAESSMGRAPRLPGRGGRVCLRLEELRPLALLSQLFYTNIGTGPRDGFWRQRHHRPHPSPGRLESLAPDRREGPEGEAHPRSGTAVADPQRAGPPAEPSRRFPVSSGSSPSSWPW